jgi:hypothetical protein
MIEDWRGKVSNHVTSTTGMFAMPDLIVYA